MSLAIESDMLRAAMRSFLVVCAAAPIFATATPPAADKLNRGDPQSSVIAFLQACRRQDYATAAQYLDLRNWSAENRKDAGPEIARKIEAALNYAPNFSPLRLTHNPDGGPAASSGNPPQVRVATLTDRGQTYTLDLERVTLDVNTQPVWVFSSGTIAAVFNLNISPGGAWITHYLPPFLSTVQFLETPLWAWIALLLAALVLLSLARHLDRPLRPVLRTAGQKLAPAAHWQWTEAALGPGRMILCIVLFRLAVEVVRPSAVARLYIGRILEFLFIWAVAWFLVRGVDLLLERVESNMQNRHEFSGRSILRLGRRTASITIVILAILTLLSSWGYNTATLIAGLGVGGIAVALAAQQTIANVFGGISVIGDRPVRIGDFGKFGDLVGTVEDIGMRSTQVRTLNRTVVSIPNSNFASANLENFSVRDKILFNPTFQIKRTTPDEEVWRLIDSLHHALEKHELVELVPTPVRLVGLTASSFNIEIFCYVQTPDIDEFYKIQGELLLAINDAFQTARLELV